MKNIERDVKGRVWGEVRYQIGLSTPVTAWTKIWDQVWGEVREQVWDKIEIQVSNQIRGAP